jgi:DNA-binding response OmpR family regulator
VTQEVKAVVVDDNRLNREIVAKILESNGVQTAQAEDAVEGWKAIKSISPKLVVLDIMLPGGLDGVDLCKMIRNEATYNDMIVVMVTAADKRRETERSLAAGANILIPKPFSPNDFWVQISSLLKGKKAKSPTYKVLVVDDEEYDALVAEKALTRAGYQVMTLTSAQGVMQKIKSFNPDLLLLDVMMPTLSGEELINIIKSDKSIVNQPRIIFYSNKSAQELRILVEQTGAAGYICKSEGINALTSNLKRLFETSESEVVSE